ncbi:MAG TPA: hypothetical protein VHW71_18125 [Steroidobacteraceae bacterium]|jgi:hypothetical protein|nr:hypothetical protein [Steroidobacteraceae bacterium]
MTVGPQVAGVQDSDAAGAAGVVAEVEDMDIPPPPQALKAAVSRTHATLRHRRRGTHAKVARCEQSIEISSLW